MHSKTFMPACDHDDLVRRFCIRPTLMTYDPYDIWKTWIGVRAKRLFNHRRSIGLLPAAALTVLDTFLNNRRRLFYTPQEYPVVRALAALSLLNLYCRTPEADLLDVIVPHLNWLVAHTCSGYSGPCWGLDFEYPVSRTVEYDSNTPLSTMTPYALEAFVRYAALAGDPRFNNVIRGIFRFLECDLCVMDESDEYLATSYASRRDRIVVNAVSYTMYSYALLLPYLAVEERSAAEAKIHKLYAFVRYAQRPDGSWFYSPEGNSFIDCFHSCIILKNIAKTAALVKLGNWERIVSKGYSYLLEHMLDRKLFLFRRFAISNKPSVIRFDLYDNAEMLNLGILLDDRSLIERLLMSIQQHFVVGRDIYSQIDIFGFRRNRNTLRWAVMPLMYAVSQL